MSKQLWKVETSHIVVHPEHYEADDHFELYRQLQETADRKKVRIDRPPIGPLEFRPVENEYSEVVVVHAFFRGKDGRKIRFMRLRREDLPDAS